MRKAWKVDGAFVPRRLEMLQSPAWQHAPRALKALLEELEIEHMRHKGCMNGQLFRSYGQFIEAGLNRNTISTMTKLGEQLGFLKVNRNSGVRTDHLREACAYTLTYLPTGTGQEQPPTDDWKRIKTKEQATAIVDGVRNSSRKIAIKTRSIGSRMVA